MQALHPAAPDPAEDSDSIESTLRDVCTGLRSDLQFTRQMHRGEPLYVLFDSVSFQAHRLSLQDYQAICCLDPNRTLQQCFQTAVEKALLTEEQESEFYQFVMQLDSLGLLTTSSRNSQQLYQRHEQLERSRRKTGIASFLFLTIPLSNPDQFLDRTSHLASWLFTRVALAVWAVALAIATVLVATRWGQFLAPLNGILASSNLIFMSVAFLGLKVWHELGHGYACKHFGGRVPEMGCRLILGMPLAYVDASSAWTFPRKRDRIIVMLGGMFFESVVAIPAAMLWALHPETMAGAFAYQLVLMAGVTTLLFNANPLMRYDGYFVLSELASIPNLRSRGSAELRDSMQHWWLGLPRRSQLSGRDSWVAWTYGLASSLYMMSLTVSIGLMMAYRFGFAGLVLAVMHIGNMSWRAIVGTFRYLVASADTESVRGRGKGLAYGGAFVLLAGICCFPIPGRVTVEGVVTAERSTVIRARTGGTLRQIHGQPNTIVQRNDQLATLSDLDVVVDRDNHRILADRSLRQTLRLDDDPTGVAKQVLEVAVSHRRLAQASERADRLVVRAPHGGRLAEIAPAEELGTRLPKGQPLALVVDGPMVVRAWLSDEQLEAANTQRGSTVRIRFKHRPAATVEGVVRSVAPGSEESFRDLALTTVAGGAIPIDPLSGRTMQPMFELLIDVPEFEFPDDLQNTTARVVLPKRWQTGAAWCYRQFQGLLHHLSSR